MFSGKLESQYQATTRNVIYMLACDVDGIDNILYAIDTGHKRDRYISIFK